MKHIAFWAALLSFLIFLITVFAGGASFPGYNHTSQFISELGATGAPHSQAVSWLGFFPAGVLLLIFSVAAFLTLPRTLWTAVAIAFIAYYSFGLIAGALFPCDFGCRPAIPTLTQIIHNVVAGTGYLTGITALLILGIQARKWQGGEHLFMLGVVCWTIGAVALLFLNPDFAYVGLAQRTIELCMYVWLLSCAWYIRGTQLTTRRIA